MKRAGRGGGPGRHPGWRPGGRAAAILLALLPLHALGQAYMVAQEPAQPGVKPILRVAAEQRYDDDVLLTGSQNAPGAFLTKVMPQVGLDLNEPRTKFMTFYGPDLLFRTGSGDLTLDHRAGLELHTEASRTAHVDA